MNGDALQIRHWMEQEKKTGKCPSRSIGFIQELPQYLWGSGRPEQSAKGYKMRKTWAGEEEI